MPRGGLLARKAFFWGAVAGTALLANFAAELGAQYIPNEGLRRFVAFIHRGPGGGQS